MRHTSIITLLSLSLFTGCAAPDDGPDPGAEDPPALGETSEALSLPRPGYGNVAWEEMIPAPGSNTPRPPGNTINDLLQHLPSLAGTGVSLTLHWYASNLNDAGRIEAVRRARAQGTPVFPWLTLDEGTAAQNQPGHADYGKTGYFPNCTNYQHWIAKAKELMTLWSNQGWGTTSFLVDAEPRKPVLEQFSRMTRDGTSPATLANWLKSGINRTRQAQCIAAFKDFANYAHARGHKVLLSTVLPMIDDFGDDDDDLRQAFAVPLENNALSASAINWDEIGFQFQRTTYMETFPQLTPYFVQDYSLLARILFGAKAGVGLGLTDGGISSTVPLYPNGTQLRLDVQAARFAGIPRNRIGVYSFYGMYRRAPISQWFPPEQTVHLPAPLDLQTGLVHASAFALDALMNGP